MGFSTRARPIELLLTFGTAASTPTAHIRTPKQQCPGARGADGGAQNVFHPLSARHNKGLPYTINACVIHWFRAPLRSWLVGTFSRRLWRAKHPPSGVTTVHIAFRFPPFADQHPMQTVVVPCINNTVSLSAA